MKWNVAGCTMTVSAQCASSTCGALVSGSSDQTSSSGCFPPKTDSVVGVTNRVADRVMTVRSSTSGYELRSQCSHIGMNITPSAPVPM